MTVCRGTGGGHRRPPGPRSPSAEAGVAEPDQLGYGHPVRLAAQVAHADGGGRPRGRAGAGGLTVRGRPVARAGVPRGARRPHRWRGGCRAPGRRRGHRPAAGPGAVPRHGCRTGLVRVPLARADERRTRGRLPYRVLEHRRSRRRLRYGGAPDGNALGGGGGADDGAAGDAHQHHQQGKKSARHPLTMPYLPRPRAAPRGSTTPTSDHPARRPVRRGGAGHLTARVRARPRREEGTRGHGAVPGSRGPARTSAGSPPRSRSRP